jgi:hypothetical protein
MSNKYKADSGWKQYLIFEHQTFGRIQSCYSAKRMRPHVSMLWWYQLS